MLSLFHCTAIEAARVIIGSQSFVDGPCRGDLGGIGGVWLSDIPLDVNQGAKGDTLLQVKLAADNGTLKHYEIIEKGTPYREWCIPAGVVNACLLSVSIAEGSPYASAKKPMSSGEMQSRASALRRLPSAPRSEWAEAANLPWLDGTSSNDTCSDTQKMYELLEPEVHNLKILLQNQNISKEQVRKKFPIIGVCAKDEDLELLMNRDEASGDVRRKKVGTKRWIAGVLAKCSGAGPLMHERYQRYNGSRKKKKNVEPDSQAGKSGK